MSEVIIQSELDGFKEKLPPSESMLTEWFLNTIRIGGLLTPHYICNTYLLLCTDASLYMLKLSKKRTIYSHKRYSLLDFTNIQVGYLSKSMEDTLDETEVNPGFYAIRLHIGPNAYKTFKYPNPEVPDDIQKAFIQVIFSTLKATRRELYLSNPHHSTPLPVPAKQPPAPPQTSPSHSTPVPLLKQDSFMISLTGYFLSNTDAHDPIEGLVTITQKHFVFEPAAISPDMDDALTILISKVVECFILGEDQVPARLHDFALSQSAKILQIFAEGKQLFIALSADQADNARSRMVQWVQAAHDRQAEETISLTNNQHSLLTKNDTTSIFKGDSDILSVKDVLYLQYKMPERYSMDKWELVYSTTRHGISINTFYTKVVNRAPNIVVVEDANHHVFGGYVSEPWVKTKQVHYGSGENFLFKLKPACQLFKWSKLNDYFMFSKPDFISFGSGGDGYGLWLDSEFDQGSSATCDTFQNEPLSNTELFKVLKLEVWAPPIYFQQNKTTRPL